jgi:hypothetical protein
MTPSPQTAAPSPARDIDTGKAFTCCQFFVLPQEDMAEFEKTLNAFFNEYRPSGPTESFLVQELVRCEWRLRRVNAIEGSLLSGSQSDKGLTEFFQADVAGDQALLKLARYESGIRRDFYRALKELQTLRRERAKQQKQAFSDGFHRMLETAMQAPVPATAPAPAPPAPATAPAPDNSKPMPAHLERELAAHKRRDPLFDPAMDASQMTKDLRRWFEKNRPAAPAPASVAPFPQEKKAS